MKKMVKEIAAERGDEAGKEKQKKGKITINCPPVCKQPRQLFSQAGSAAEDLSVLTESDLKALSTKISSQWKKLVPKFGLPNSVLDKIEADNSADEGRKKLNVCCEFLMTFLFKLFIGRAMALLEAWKSAEGEEASKEELLYILEGLKLKSLGEGVLF